MSATPSSTVKTMSETHKFPPALSITSVKSLIPITLDIESGQYHSLSALFKVQARVHDVLDHIILPTDEKEKAGYEKTKADDVALWKWLDAVVLQWIYATNKKTLPTFATARSKLALEDTTLLERAKQEFGFTALVANNYSPDVVKLVADAITTDGAVKLVVVDISGINNNPSLFLSSTEKAPWAMPPCPYPTQPWAHQTKSRQPGVLGLRPQQQQAYATTAPTDIESAMHTMSLSQPDPDWYMDTGTTSHMTSTQVISQQPPTGPRPVTRNQHSIYKPNPKYTSNQAHYTTITRSPLPRNPLAALRDPNWKLAMDDEFNALVKNKTWDLVPRPPDVNVIRSMWIFTHKEKSDGSFERHKAREMGKLNRDYVHPDYVCLLRKSLYGLKQAPRALYKRFSGFLSVIGFTNSKSDNSLFIYQNGFDLAYLLLYVDDIILTASTDDLRYSIMASLSSKFAMKDLGSLNYFLGISSTRHDGGLFLSQQKYAAEIIDRAGMSTCKPTQTPVNTKPKVNTKTDSYEDPKQYGSLAGALQYLTFTTPNISYDVQQICLHMHDPKDEHMNALKRIIRYVKGTLHLGLHLYPSSVADLVSYTDVDWGGCPNTRRSTSGYGVFLGDNLISWSSKRQPTLSRSSAEAEYRGVANVVSESCWIHNLLLELHCLVRKATLVYCDNVSALYLSGNPVQHQRTKHIEMDIHFIRERVARGEVRVRHVPSRYQIADIFTKGLPLILFEDFRNSLSVCDPPVSTAGV
ncbi:hypothetical protein TSUD_241870 [Trifolium subterraneum]|uniref:Reverse transcriptase Ty1/copia-type domain-containing protein n=1 Tax=Trifolium subterraneum TaxID=3900 RepID=A0A2Z6PW72_TRISU|nr:hypothetical protein TSUD_241870 [Trifolium subterraneum]